MRALLLAVVGLALSACAAGSARVSTASSNQGFRAKTVALASVAGAGAKGAEIARILTARLASGGIRAASLEDADSVLAGSALGLDIASDPRVLAEVRRATGADAIVFLTLDAGWRTLDISALDLAGGEPVLRAKARPGGAYFETPDEVASVAAEALSFMAPQRARASAAARASGDELAEPDAN